MTSISMLRTRWAAVGAAVAVTIGAVGLGGLNIVSADVSSGDRPVFIPINPCRLLDTRPGVANVGPRSSPLGPGETYAVTAHGSNGECTGASVIPTDAVSLALNVTAVGASASTFLTFWGDGANPGTSNLNPRPGAAPTPNSVNTPLSTAGNFNIYNDAGSVGVIADVNGYYVGHDHDDRYYTEAESDDRYEQQQTGTEAELVIDGLALRPLDPASTWAFDTAWVHTSSTDTECLVADVELPVGATLSSAELHYTANSTIEAGAAIAHQPSGVEAVAGPPSTTLVQFLGDLAPTAPDEIAVRSLSVNPTPTLLGYSQTLSVCSAGGFAVGSVRLTYTNP